MSTVGSIFDIVIFILIYICYIINYNLEIESLLVYTSSPLQPDG